MSSSSQIWTAGKAHLLRHVLGAVLLVAAWKMLQTWYTFQHSHDYLIFAMLAVFGFLLGAGPFLYREIKNIPPIRILVCLPLLLLLLPWAEWLELGTIFTREGWSEMLFLQGVFVYVCISILVLFPVLASTIRAGFLQILEKLALNRFLIWAPPVLLFLLTSAVALFFYRETPIVQDSATHLFQAHVFSRFKLFAPAPPVPEAFTGPIDLLILKDGKWFGLGFPGFAALMAPATWLDLQWLVSPLLAALTAAIWIAYACRWHERITAVLTGWLILLCPFVVVMSSTVMVFTPELFFASAVIYLSRLSLESQSVFRIALLTVMLAGAILVRPFSILIFLFPVIAYTLLQSLIRRRLSTFVVIVFGIVAGLGCLAFFQWKTTGDPLLSGYQVELPEQKMGFGPDTLGTHTPLKGMGNLSNNLLGLNQWLGGWYSGSMIFILAFLLTGKIQLWDKLLLTCCVLLMLFYFFYFIQDLFFGPRFYYVFTPILLLFLARGIVLENIAPNSGRKILVPLFAATLVISVPRLLPSFVARYNPSQSQAGQLKEEIRRNGDAQTLVFLDKNVGQNFVNWNDPFLKSPMILCRDLGKRNVEVQKYFPGHRVVWFRMNLSYEKGKITSGFKFTEEPDRTPAGSLSLFELAMALQAAREYPKRDFFDICYIDLFNASGARKNYEFLERAEKKPLLGGEYKRHFRKGVVHAGKMLLLPKIAFEEQGLNWHSAFEPEQFLREFDESRQAFIEAGDVGMAILDQMKKVHRRIDRDSDEFLSDSEIQIYLTEKIKLLNQGGAL